LAAHRRQTAMISLIALGEFAEGFADPRALVDLLAPFRVVTLSRATAWRTAVLQSSLSRQLGENDAWMAATALSYEATLVGRERAFERLLGSITCRSTPADRCDWNGCARYLALDMQNRPHLAIASR
jgi:predicted nucleic acid-binding protein